MKGITNDVRRCVHWIVFNSFYSRKTMLY